MPEAWGCRIALTETSRNGVLLEPEAIDRGGPPLAGVSVNAWRAKKKIRNRIFARHRP